MLKLKNIAAQIQLAYSNYLATKTSRRIVVIESDDWGGVRMPNLTTLHALLKTSLKVDDNSFNRLDGLERKDDIELLLEVLQKHRDQYGNPPKFTCNMVLGNPNFEAIEKNGFNEFVRESMFDSYRRYNGEDLRPLWDEAISKRLVQPQFHCREHLNTGLWMRDLRAGQPETNLCFQHRFFGLRTRTSSKVQKHYLAAYSAENEIEMEEIKVITKKGLDEFETVFGFRSSTFVACNYVLPVELEKTLADGGVSGIQTRIKQTVPSISNHGRRTQIRRFTGQLNAHGQRFIVRNSLFEPYRKTTECAVSRALHDIGQAFWFRTPAVVCSHRVNYSSAIGVRLRDSTLRSLDRLLTQICDRWPDVEFLTTDELLKVMSRT